MRNGRARLIAAAVVALAALGSAAYGEWRVTSNPASSGSGAYDQPMRILVSVRNVTGGSLTISSITKANPIPTNCVASIQLSPVTGTFPVTLASNQQAQFAITTTGISQPETMFGTPGCQWDINDSTANPIETFGVFFNVSGGGPTWEMQPMLNDFGSQSGFEIQKVWVLNHNASAAATYTDVSIMDPSGSFTFASKCPGQQTCSGLTTVNAGAYEEIDVKCDPTIAGMVTGMMTISSGSLLASKMLTCTGVGAGGSTIDLVPTMVDINGPGMNSAAVTYTGMVDWSMTGATISGDIKNVFSFLDPTCSSHTCDWSANVVPLPSTIDISCTPIDSTIATATLRVQGIGGINDFDTATLRCIPSGMGGGPKIQLSTNQITMPSQPVSVTSSPMPLTVTNTGSGTLTFQLFPGSTEWAASSCQNASCDLVGMGSSTVVNIAFTPITHGDRGTNMLVNSNDTVGNGMLNVALNGSGSGGVLEVTTPSSPFEIDFGTIPRGSMTTRNLIMLNTGNAGIMVTPSGTTSPFSIAPATVNLAPGVPDAFTVGCGSNNSGGPYTTTIMLGTDAYTWNTTQVTAVCTIADTNVMVTPTQFDFDEHRVGSPATDMMVTIHNPGSVPVTLHSLKLSGSSPVLSLAPTVGSDMQIGAGSDFTANLHLATTQDSDLAGLMLQIGVDSANLSYPITGKVTTPAAHVAPAMLDLGTACVGSQVSGTVMMINDGTASLTMQRPTMNQAFTPVYQQPSTYPAPLLAGHSAMVGVTPSASAIGPLDGTLTWEVDAPNSPFAVPVSLTYIQDGAAVSPRALEFGRIDVDEHSGKQTITLENCDVAPATIDIAGVTATQGAASAWQVSPSVAQILLAAHGKQTISVELVPPKPGHYEARLSIAVNGEDRSVALTGDALGKTIDEKSFYACTCNGGDAPVRGWPVGAAVLIVVLRRRRR